LQQEHVPYSLRPAGGSILKAVVVHQELEKRERLQGLRTNGRNGISKGMNKERASLLK
jgi:hypothetical protein